MLAKAAQDQVISNRNNNNSNNSTTTGMKNTALPTEKPSSP